MDTMSTSHHNHCFRRSKHVVAANGTVALSGSLDTAMCILNRDWQANAACLSFISIKMRVLVEFSGTSTNLAVKKVLSKSLSNATYAAIIAMIDAFFAIIIPELANATVILSGLLATLPADLCRWLSMST